MREKEIVEEEVEDESETGEREKEKERECVRKDKVRESREKKNIQMMM